MKGLLVASLPENLSTSLFNLLMSMEEGIFKWAARGPRIFNKIVAGVGSSGLGVGADVVRVPIHHGWRSCFRPIPIEVC